MRRGAAGLALVVLGACAGPGPEDGTPTLPEDDSDPVVTDDSDPRTAEDLHPQLQRLLLDVVDGVLGLRNRLLPEGLYLGGSLHDDACPATTSEGAATVHRGGCTTDDGVRFDGVLTLEGAELRADGWRVAFEERPQAEIDGVVTREPPWDFVFVGATSGPSSAALDPAGITLERYAFRSWIEGDVRPHLYEVRGSTARTGPIVLELTAIKHDDWDVPAEWGGSARLELLGHVVELDMDLRDADTGCPTTRIDGAPAAPLCLL